MSMNRVELGRLGEGAAALYLERKGYAICGRNVRLKSGEVDIIARHTDCLVFIEVKAKTSLNYGYPEEMVDERKIMRQENAYHELIAIHPELYDLTFRLDVISVMIDLARRTATIDHIENYNN